MNKKYFLFIFVLALVIGVLSLSLYSIKFSSANTCLSEVDNTSSENISQSFDVSDFSGANVNTIDIPSISYDYNQISVRGSDFRISDDLQAKIMDAINSYGASSSFYIVSLNDGMSVGYNIDKQYETASSIKAPYALYVYEEIAKGNINPDQEFEYTSNFYNKGTGIIKNSDFGTKYNVRQLVYYSLTESDGWL